MTINRKAIGFAAGPIVIAAIIWLYAARSGSPSTADLTGHWDGPQRGLYLDASSGRIFQLDIMHTFFFGSWRPRSADSCSLQFYDLSGETPVMNNPSMVGSATIRRAGGKVFCDLIMPDGGTCTFHHTGPPSERLKDLKFD